MMTSGLNHWRTLRWIVPAAAAAPVVTVIAAFMLLPPAYKAVKRRRAEKAVHRAEIALERRDWKAADRDVLLAITLCPDLPAALRLAARAMTLIHEDGHALTYWRMLFARDAPTRSDRLMYLTVLRRTRRTDLMREPLTALLRRDPHDCEAMELAYAMFMDEGRIEDALTVIETLASEQPDREGVELLLGRTMLAAGARQQGIRVLWQVAFGRKPGAFAAITELSWTPEVTTNELRLLGLRAPSTQTNELLLSIVDQNIRLRLDPSVSVADSIRNVAGRVRGDATVEERVAAADWLGSKGADDLALKFTAMPWCRTNEAVLQRHLNALGRMDRWDDVEKIVDDERVVFGEVMRGIYRAIIASHRGRIDEAAVHLESATRAASDDTRALEVIAAYAESLDKPDIAAAALRPSLDIPVLAASNGPRVLGLLARVDHVLPMLNAIDRLLVLDPSNDGLILEKSWLRLLVGEQADESIKTARELAGRHPKEPRFAAPLALGLMQSQSFDEAFRVLEEARAEDVDAPFRLKLVLCAALGLVGERDHARRVGSTLPLDRLRSEERILVQDWIAKPGAARGFGPQK